MSKPWYTLLPLALVIAAIVTAVSLPHRTSIESSVATSTSGATSSAVSSSTSIQPSTHVTAAMTGTVNGTVLLGPTCPVEHIPPEPQCADKPYQTSIRIYKGDSSALYRTISSSAQGKFSVQLAAGSYTFAPVGGGGMPPTCRSAIVSVATGHSQEIQLDCDTGIR